MNILCCLAVLSEFNLNTKNIKSFQNQKPLKEEEKLKVKKFGEAFYLVDESYNATHYQLKSFRKLF